LQEAQEELNIRRDIQVFGTDIDRAAIEKAREGLYLQNITADVSEKRIKRFFEKDHIHYRVRKGVRESVVFAVQNLLKDPPFSRLDLLVCRNLLIYLEAKAQKRLLPLFHYALKPGGTLFLGSSETIGDFTDLFIPLQKKWNFYRKVDVIPALQLAVHFPIGGKDMANALERARTGADSMDVSEPAVAQATENLLLENHTPACVVVNRRGEINYVHGRTGKFLEPAQGRMSVNIVDMAREGVRFDLAAALRKVASSGEIITRQGLRVKSNGDSLNFNLMVKPLGKPESLKDMIVVIFEEIPVERQLGNSKNKKTALEGASSQRVIDLEREMAKVQQDHRTAMEELETSNEELKSVNEELQSSNEELQSTNEELESSREELQSLNEELTTVNAEHHDKITELSQAYDSITHVLNCTRIAIVFVDNQLNVMRFTQEATRLINLIDADIGRPLTHISTNLDYPLLLDDIKTAVGDIEVLERQVITKDGHRYSMRIAPFRDQKGRNEGAILTFINADGWPGAGNSGRETGGTDESITTGT
ncbi:MAG: CheR family methyltransferase, partial [Desulfosalsimonadaceae bacterium]|nr:CheR family methyltransferase [Desulfosalsimonadaceae bacterium]